MAYGSDPFAGLVNPARANARPMSSGGCPVLSYGAMQGGMRQRGNAAPDSYASVMAGAPMPTYSTPLRPNDAFGFGLDANGKPIPRPNDAFGEGLDANGKPIISSKPVQTPDTRPPGWPGVRNPDQAPRRPGQPRAPIGRVPYRPGG